MVVSLSGMAFAREENDISCKRGLALLFPSGTVVNPPLRASAFRLSEGSGRVGVEVGMEKRGIFREYEMKVVGQVDRGVEGSGPDFEDMPAVAAVGTHKVKVVTGHIDRAGVGGGKKSDEGALDAFKLELRLMRGGFDQAGPGLGLAGDPDMDKIENAVDAESGEEIVGGSQLRQAMTEVGPILNAGQRFTMIGAEFCGDPERCRGGFRNFGQRSIPTGTVGHPVNEDTLTVEPDKGSQAEIPMPEHIPECGGGFVDSLHQSTGGGDLENRMLLHIQRLGQTGGNGLVERFSRAQHALAKRVLHAGGNSAGQRNGVG
jgi:hypothetical protein